MNNAILQAAKDILKHHVNFPEWHPHAVFGSLGAAYCDTESAASFLQQSVHQANTIYPLQGVALQLLYEHAKEEDKANVLLQNFYPKIVAMHRFWYDHNDPQEEGLPYTPHEKNRIQDSIFLALLVWSNESLIHMGHLLEEDVLEIIQWNELSIYSINEKLWDEAQRGYQPFDLEKDHLIPSDFCQSFVPMVGEIPTQDRAERILPNIKRWHKKAERLNVLEAWLLWHGLLRYDFVEMAAQVKQRLLECIRDFGFYENFDAQNGEPLTSERGQSLLTAALVMDLVKRC